MPSSGCMTALSGFDAMPMSRIESAKFSLALLTGTLAAASLALIGWASPAAHADEERRSQGSLSTGFKFTESTGEQLFANVCQGCHMPDGGGASVAQADIVRYPIPNSTFPIAQAVRVSGDAVTYYVSGQVPPVISRDADPSSPQAYGDTKTQTVGVLNKIKQILEGQGLGMADVVKMQVFLVHDARAPMDFKAFMEGRSEEHTSELQSPMYLVCR